MEHVHHSGHGHGSGTGHGSAEIFLKRFWVVTFLLIPLVFANQMVMQAVGLQAHTLSKWFGFFIATVIFGFALVFFEHAWHEIKAKQYGMMTLVSLAVGAGYLFSVVATFVSTLEADFYLEISTLIWVLMFGHYLEARSGAAAGNALSEVAKLLPKKAHRLIGDREEEIEISELKVDDLVLVKPGEKIPADGVVSLGVANVNEALISGESKPLSKKAGDEVVAGSICLDGSLTIRLTRVGEHSTIGQIKNLIAKAEMTKPKSQRLADKAAAILTAVAAITALLTVLVWSLILGETFVFSITLAITVLVIACPHALGLAIPTVTTITTSIAIKSGFFIKNLAKLEVLKKVNYVVFDKTGTLTTGEFGVNEVVAVGDEVEANVLAVAASLEQHSSHIIGQSIVADAKNKNLQLHQILNFKNIAGKGVQAEIDEEIYVVGNVAMMESFGVEIETVKEKYIELSSKGKTVVFVAKQKKIIGLIVLSDAIKKEAFLAVERLHGLGVKVAMLTGDNQAVAKAVAEELKIDTYFAEVLPEDKYQHIKSLQERGGVVVMVGDGVNDAPALTQSDVGVAIGAGTDVAVEAGDVVLTRNNPEDVARLIILAKKVYVKMVQNLVWALGYNIIAIPAAAGVFASQFFFGGFLLRPEIGALIMSLSTVIVVANALLLKRVNLK
ncbi:MAG: heavy metal translocating P-type ATPase [Candidatus Nomurabacteria bacterium]|nr:MAG: heavy metal translocating P-type ATPase [Candidatus Nomurabacteria bacterium]